jgi:L-Ala-D/L-Glu epimerase
MRQVSLHIEIEQWPLIEPFRITGYTWSVMDVVHVTLEEGVARGRGEAAGVYYRGETAASMVNQIERVRPHIEAGICRQELRELLTPGGARNAVDCALWDLEAKLTGRPVWEIAGLKPSRPLVTTFTCGAATPSQMASVALAYKGARAIKLKLTGESCDAERVCAVRHARPDVWLSIDANQGFSRSFLEELMPVLVRSRVSLIEQPFPIGQEALLDGFHSSIPVAADESVQCLQDVSGAVDRFQMINIKLDKCGGLTEGLAMAAAARKLGIECMVGNMIGTSLAIAPACIVGQLCSVADLDGPIFLRKDRAIPVRYVDGQVVSPKELWGHSP